MSAGVSVGGLTSTHAVREGAALECGWLTQRAGEQDAARSGVECRTARRTQLWAGSLHPGAGRCSRKWGTGR